MTIAEAGIDLDLVLGTDSEQSDSTTSTASDTALATGKTPETAAKEVAEEIAGMFMTPENEEEVKTEAKPEKKAEAKKTEERDETQLDAALVREAGTWGMHPEEARLYPSNAALRAVVRDRETRHYQAQRRRETTDTTTETKEEKALDLPVFEMEVDDETDPAVAKMAESMKTYAASLKTQAEAEIKAMRDEVGAMRDESSATAERTSRATQTKIAHAFDEEVASWGDQFEEMLGVPSQSITGDGSQRAEAQRLNEYVTQMQAGYAAIHGAPDPEEAVRLTKDFVRQGRHALWPEMAQKDARRSVSKQLRNQKGGVAMRPKQARSNEPPEQGDDAAKAAIDSFMVENGLDPWGRKPSA